MNPAFGKTEVPSEGSFMGKGSSAPMIYVPTPEVYSPVDKGKEEPKFDFDPPMQDDILRMMSKEMRFTEASSRWIKPAYFVGLERMWLSSYITRFYEEYSLAPTKSEVRQGLRDAIRTGSVREHDNPREDARPEEVALASFIDTIYDRGVSGSADYTLENLKKFARHRAWEKAIVMAAPLLRKGKFEEVNEIMDRASASVSDFDLGVYWYFETLKERANRRVLKLDSEKIIPSGILEVDVNLRRGGYGPGESVVWLAKKGGGKSICLSSVIRRATVERKRTAFISYEMGDEQNAARLDSGFSGVSMWDLDKVDDGTTAHSVDHQKKLLSKVGALASRFPRSIMIKKFPTKGASIKDVDKLLTNVRKIYDGWEPDMIVLDYLGIAKAPRKREKRTEEILELSEEFRWLLGVWDVPGHTAAQLSKKGAQRKTADGSNAAGSWDQLATFDYIYVLNQDREERLKSLMRIYIDKARDGYDKFPIGPFETMWDKMCFVRATGKAPWEVRAYSPHNPDFSKDIPTTPSSGGFPSR